MTILLNTKLRKNLLAYTFTHPDEDFYVRELAALIGSDPGNLSRELRKFEEEGLFVTRRRGRLKLYKLSKIYPLFRELKTIIFKTEGVAGSLKELLGKYPGISMGLIYGSYAKNQEKSSSDVDLIVVGELPLKEFLRQIRQLESKLSREINFTSYALEEFGKEIKKKGSFLNVVLKDKIILLKGQLHARSID